MPEDYNFGVGAIPPMRSMSQSQPMAYGQLGMSMPEMMQHYMMPRGVPQVGGLFGQSGQQAVNAVYPMLQEMVRQQMMQQGTMPIFAGAGAPWQQMQQNTFRNTLSEAMKLSQAQDLPMLAARAGKAFEALGLGAGVGRELVQGIGSLPPFLSGMIMPYISQALAPEGTRGDLTQAIVASTRGRMAPNRINELSSRIFSSLSTGEGEDARFDVSRTGGLGARQVGELMFEMQRRGFTNVLNDESVASIGERAGFKGAEALSRGQSAVVKGKLNQLGDVLGMMDEMLGGNAPMGKILTALEGISGKNILASGANVNQIKQQLTKMSSMADVLGIAPQAMMAIAQGNAMNLQAQGMGRGLSMPMTTHQMTMVTAGQAAMSFSGTAGMPGFDQTEADYGRAAGMLTSRGVQSRVGRILGSLSFIQSQGLGGEKLDEFFAKDYKERAKIMYNRASREGLLADVRSETEPWIVRGLLSDPKAGDYIPSMKGGLATIYEMQAMDFTKDISSGLTGREGLGKAEIAGLVRDIDEGNTLSPRQKVMLAVVRTSMEKRTGASSVVLANLFGGKARSLVKKLGELGELSAIRAEAMSNLAEKMPQGFVAALEGKGGNFNSLLKALAGGPAGIDLRKLAAAATAAGDPAAAKALETFELTVTDIQGMKISDDDKKKKFVEAHAEFFRAFPGMDPSSQYKKANFTSQQSKIFESWARQSNLSTYENKGGAPTPEQMGLANAFGGVIKEIVGKLEISLNIPNLGWLGKMFLRLTTGGGVTPESQKMGVEVP